MTEYDQAKPMIQFPILENIFDESLTTKKDNKQSTPSPVSLGKIVKPDLLANNKQLNRTPKMPVT